MKMSFPSKSNGRSEYISRSNSNSNKSQTMNYRNSLTNNQHSNGSNGEVYSYDDKSQHNCNSPKIVTEGHAMSQHNTSPRDTYSYKNNSTRAKQYHPNKSYNDKHGNYYNQPPCSADDIIIPEIEHLKEFVKEQTDRFKMELSRHENQMSSSPSPCSHHYNDQANYKYNKPYGSLGRTGNGFPVSHSLGSIVNSSGVVPVTNLTVSPSCLDNSSRHQDVRLVSQQNSFAVTKNSNGYNNYSKYPSSSQNSGKPSPGLARNLSHDETFSKSPNNLKIRNDSPNNNVQNTEKNIKTQFPSPTNSSNVGNRQDPKKAYYRSNKSFSFAVGSNAAMHQLNQNNSVTANIVASESRKNEQSNISSRPMSSSVVRNNGGPQRSNISRRGYGTPGGYENNTADSENTPAYRAVVSVETCQGRRTLSNHSNIVDDQDNSDNHLPEQYFTPEPSGSPSSTTRSSPESTNVVTPHSQNRQH